MSVKIITDSTSDIQREEAEKLGLGMVPLKVIMEGETYRDGIDISKEEYYAKLPGMKKLPTTTQPSPDEFIQEFEKAEEDELVVIVIGGGVSGTVQSATIAAEAVPNKKIYIVDSLQTSAGLGILVHRAVQLRDQGLSGAEIAAKLDDEKKDIKLIAVINDIKNLYKSGRMNKGTMVVASILGIKPVVMLEPHGVEAIGKERGTAKAYKFVRDTATGLGELDTERPCAVGYTHTPEIVDDFVKVMGKEWCPDNIHVQSVGCALGTHLNVGAIVYAYFRKRA
ncbi:MAG: DegV family protein [Clostridia bacterium]|nr:DegV family protein [Clostridia bacterium]